MDVQKELAEFKEKFDHELKNYLDDTVAQTRKKDRFVGNALDHFATALLAGGKRLRPAMMYYGYLAGGGRASKEIIRATMSIELIHGFLLMHDDIIDRDDFRHGTLTMHAKYTRYAQKFFQKDDAEHFGNTVGIIIGDAVHSLGFNILLDADFPSQHIVQSLKTLEEIVAQTAIGEMQDVHIEYKKKATEKEILAMYENKTARYTFEGPLHLGMSLAGASQKHIIQLGDAVIPLGIAFQIQDDILGVFGHQKKTGKPVGSDIVGGKFTILVAHAYKHASRTQKKVLDRLLGIEKESLTFTELRNFQDVLTDIGTHEYAIALSQTYFDDAVARIDAVEMPQRSKAFLGGLAQYLHGRSV